MRLFEIICTKASLDGDAAGNAGARILSGVFKMLYRSWKMYWRVRGKIKGRMTWVLRMVRPESLIGQADVAIEV